VHLAEVEVVSLALRPAIVTCVGEGKDLRALLAVSLLPTGPVPGVIICGYQVPPSLDGSPAGFSSSAISGVSAAGCGPP